MTDEEIIDIVSAHAAGAKIEYRQRLDTVWTYVPNPTWNFDEYFYREVPVAIERYLNILANDGGTHVYLSEEAAVAGALYDSSAFDYVAVHVREVKS